jgi:fructose-specific phosphotransferase system IIA component
MTLSLRSKRKPELIGELVSLLAAAGKVDDRDAVYRAIMERERMSTTGIGDGIAIPHCLTPAAQATHMAFGRRVPGAKFDAVDNRPVQLFFLIVGPEGAHNEHLRLLSKLARYLHDQQLRKQLLTAKSTEEIVALFRQKEG